MDRFNRKTPEILTFEDPDTYPESAAGWIADRLRELASRKEGVSIGLSGGSTPASIYRALSRNTPGAGIPWRRITFFFGDERCVPPEHEQSNYRMAKEALFDHIPIDGFRVRRIRGEEPDPSRAAALYEELAPESFDLLLLGMGGDGHTASLFPGSPALEEDERKFVAVTAPVYPRMRVTLTPPVIAGAGLVAVLIKGREKARAVYEALSGEYNPVKTPIQLALNGTWILDGEAAAMVGEICCERTEDPLEI